MLFHRQQTWHSTQSGSSLLKRVEIQALISNSFAGNLKQPKNILPTQRQLDWLVSDMADMFLKRLLLRKFTKIVKPIAD
jgi:hypothetical protein